MLKARRTRSKISSAYLLYQQQLTSLEDEFVASQHILHNKRNIIKQLTLNDKPIVIKSFRIPNIIQAWIYANARPTKARRSYEHAKKLIARGIDTHEPIAYIEHYQRCRLKQSYFVSSYIEHDFTIGDVLDKHAEADLDIIRKFTEFTYAMHRAGALHLDHNPGNTLIRASAGSYHFSVIDINRMYFGSISLKRGLSNFVRLTDEPIILKTIAETYASCANKDAEICRQLFMQLKENHNRKVNFQKRLKNWIKNLLGNSSAQH